MKLKASFTAAGDVIINRHLTEPYEGFEEVRSEIGKGDFRFFNLETTIHDNRTFGGKNSGGAWLCAPPEILESVKRFGFNITTAANNHTMDFMYVGLEKTLEHLRAVGLPNAGTGLTLEEASSPCYLDLPKARIALIGACSTFQPEAMAGEQTRYMPGRPGLNGLGYRITYPLAPRYADIFREIIAATGVNASREAGRAEGYLPALPEGVLEFGTLELKIEESFEIHSAPDSGDMERIERAIYEAQLQADYIVVSIHTHEAHGPDKHRTPEFIEEFARRCIDSGAHAVIGHGPHLIRAVEIYKGCPIFYSLGDFIFQNENLHKAPAEFFAKYGLPGDATMHDLFKARSANFTRGLQSKRTSFESFIPHWEMEDGRLTSLTLLAVELGFELPHSRSGWPVPARDSSILEQLAGLSEAYGTKLKIDGNRAEIVL